jgi:hypothetical protein
MHLTGQRGAASTPVCFLRLVACQPVARFVDLLFVFLGFNGLGVDSTAVNCLLESLSLESLGKSFQGNAQS